MELSFKIGNIFDECGNEDIVHCVAADILSDPKSGTQGIAVEVQEHYLFKDILDMSGANPKVGQCLYSEGVFNLITKEKYFLKPTNDTMLQSLQSLKDLCKIRGVDSLRMPKIGCGLDKLDWYDVVSMIKEVFKDTDISITVYSLY